MWTELEVEWRTAVRAATTSRLVTEKPLVSLLWWAIRDAADDEPPIVVDISPEMTEALLRSAVTKTRAQTVGSRAVHRSDRLYWDTLVTVAGGEEQLRQRIDALRASADEDLTDLIALCDRYFDGWRPD